MKKPVRIALISVGAVLVLLGVALVSAASIGAKRFRQRYESERDELLRRARAASPATIANDAVLGLPAPLQRYLEVTGTRGATPPRLAMLTQRGELRTARDKPWMPLEAEQVYAMEPPGFVWFAAAQLAPLATMNARDKFVDGHGNMWIRLLGVLTVADSTGPGMDQGAGLRHWGEVMAFPEMVKSPYVRWEAMDERRARMRVRQGVLALEAVLEFGPDGLPSALHAQRNRDVEGRSVLTPWSGTMSAWKRFGGRLFPAHWESTWHLPEGDFTAVKLDMVTVRTE